MGEIEAEGVLFNFRHIEIMDSRGSRCSEFQNESIRAPHEHLKCRLQGQSHNDWPFSRCTPSLIA